uniref:Uncharacterized protein n=1 Tax=Peronospora matthiolae TaxID=2874970 RepID=A0AAV1UQ90_9STRA
MDLPDQRGLRLHEGIKACIELFWASGHNVVDLLGPNQRPKVIEHETSSLEEVVMTLHLFAEVQSKMTQL